MSALPQPGPEEVHVWQGSLEVADATLERLAALLSGDEGRRAATYKFERDRRRFVAGRGMLRLLLGGYISCDPAAVEFVYGPHGKPLLAGPGPWFNVSHSGEVIMIAFSSRAEVGVDVEVPRSRPAAGRVAERFFSPAEVAALRALPVDQQDGAFLACWTRKEAFIKARGDGLSLPLSSFDVTLRPGQAAALTRTAWSAEEPAEWTIADLSEPGGRFAAAVASRSRGWRAVVRSLGNHAHLFEPRSSDRPEGGLSSLGERP